MPSSREGREVYYAGKVQGVGFRYTARGIAAHYAVTGLVRNLDDGRVQLVAEGAAPELDRFLKEIAQRMEGHIESVECLPRQATDAYRGFEIG